MRFDPTAVTVLLVAVILAAFSPGAFADVYKCELPGGKVEYQPMPCAAGKATLIKAPAPSTQVQTQSPAQAQAQSPVPSVSEASSQGSHKEGPRRVAQSLQDGVTLRLAGPHRIPLRVALESIAFVAGYTLAMDASITDVGNFEYEDVPGSVLLAELARRYNLDIRTDNRVIAVARR